MDTNELPPLAGSDSETFPYDEVVAHFNEVGKHFVSPELLGELDRVRATLPDGDSRLSRFLHTALDKFDGRYDNPSYLALDELGLPGADGCPDPGHAHRRRDRLLVLLMADMMRFELAAADGQSELMPELRPGPKVTAKRCRHGLRAIRSASASISTTRTRSPRRVRSAEPSSDRSPSRSVARSS
jgi:hypothetical protein